MLVAISYFLSVFVFYLYLFYIYLGLSVFTFIFYARDKRAAQKGAWRTSENTLHLLALFGGWPGALLAQNRLRHKSKKLPFKVVLWLTIAINCSALVCLFTPSGATFWQQVINAFPV